MLFCVFLNWFQDVLGIIDIVFVFEELLVWDQRVWGWVLWMRIQTCNYLKYDYKIVDVGF